MNAQGLHLPLAWLEEPALGYAVEPSCCDLGSSGGACCEDGEKIGGGSVAPPDGRSLESIVGGWQGGGGILFPFDMPSAKTPLASWKNPELPEFAKGPASRNTGKESPYGGRTNLPGGAKHTPPPALPVSEQRPEEPWSLNSALTGAELLPIRAAAQSTSEKALRADG